MSNRWWLSAVCVAVVFAAAANALALKHHDRHAREHASTTITTTTMVPETIDTEAAALECGAAGNFLNGTFTGWDYSVVLGMLIISIGIGKQTLSICTNDICLTRTNHMLAGVFYGFFDKASTNSEDFLRGSGMQLFPVSLSLTTSFITAIELLGNPSEMFFNGTQYALIGMMQFWPRCDVGVGTVLSLCAPFIDRLQCCRWPLSFRWP